MKASFIVQLSLFFLSITNLKAQSVNQIVKSFIEADEVHSQRISIGYESPIYKNFERLIEIASIEELIELTQHDNPVVQTYAGWALIEKSYGRVAEVFSFFLKNDKEVNTYVADMKDKDYLSSIFYHRYWNSLETASREQDNTLFKMDSILLYHHNPDWLLILRALENRIYPRKFHPRIEYLAFEKLDKNALFYLSNWHKAEYRDQLKAGLIRYLQETNFKNVGVTGYYEVIRELLQFREDNINAIVVEKLRTDKHWEHQRKWFVDLLTDNSIYEPDLQ
jgi:hypothetical protein